MNAPHKQSPPRTPPTAHYMTSPAETRASSLTQILAVESFTYIVVCCTDASQAQYWTERLESVHSIVHRGKVICTHEADWNGNAGNGLGTLYAFECTQQIAQDKFQINLQEEMANGASIGLYHIAGKGTRLAPLPGLKLTTNPVYNYQESCKSTVWRPTLVF